MLLRLVVPDLHLDREGLDGAAADALPRLPALETVLRSGRRLAAPADWRALLAGWAGRPDLADRSPASLVAAAAGLPDPGSAWLASPVHLLAGLDHLRLHPAGLLRLDPAAAASLAADFARDFGADGLALQPIAGGFLLTGLPRIEAVATEPSRLLGADLRRAPPTGPDAAVLRRLGTEIEMWLHARAAQAAPTRGLAPNGLWLWGGGVSGGPVSRSPQTGCEGSLQADDPAALALWSLGGGEPQPPAADFGAFLPGLPVPVGPAAVCLSVAPRGPGDRPLARLENDWLVPALAALRVGQLAGLSLHVAGRHWELRRPVGWRFWRRSRPWWDVLAT